MKECKNVLQYCSEMLVQTYSTYHCFVLVRIMINLEPIPRTMDVRCEYTLDGMPLLLSHLGAI